jgi:hypothetical protein
VPRGGAQLVLDLAQDRVTIGLEGIIAGPDLIDDLDAGIVAVGMDADQPAAGPQRRTSGVTTFDALNSTLARAR